MNAREISFVIYVTMSLLLVSCVTAPTKDQLEVADYGSAPENYEEIIRYYMQRVLKDPDSAQYNFTTIPLQMWKRDGFGSRFKFGWGVCALINAKNSFGGFVGNQNHFFLIRDGTIIDAPGPGFLSDKSCNGRTI